MLSFSVWRGSDPLRVFGDRCPVSSPLRVPQGSRRTWYPVRIATSPSSWYLLANHMSREQRRWFSR